MLQSDKVKSGEEGKFNLKQAYKEAKLTQEELAQKAKVSVDTLKRLLGTKECPNGVERLAVINIAKVLGIEPTNIVDPKDWNPQQQLPPEFEPVIKEKTKTFCGREFVFAAFEKFINTKQNGYFTVVGDAGMGKSALAAKYVFDKQVPCYFNILAEGRNRPELFLKSIRQQLISRYQLQDANDDDLATLLTKVSRKLPAGDRLVIVIDALDEVEQEPGAENLLYLPRELPEQVYFLLTRRPFSLEKKRLQVSVPEDCLDLSAGEYANFSREDVKAYIRLLLNHDPEYRDALNKWIQDRNYTPEYFVEQVAEKSENNFMYLYHALPAIAKGEYDDLALEKFPKGLQDYYQVHWLRMGMETEPKELMVIVLLILVEISTPITCQTIAAIAEREIDEVEDVLEDKWVEYVKKQWIERQLCYSIYHASFLDFLQKKRDVKRIKRLYQDVNGRIADYIYS
jgi:lambda repressor-like predicted transcriptional regulator